MYRAIFVIAALSEFIAELCGIFKDSIKQLNQKSIHCTATHSIAVAVFVVFFIIVLWSIYP